MLRIVVKKYHKVQAGQTAKTIAEAYGVSVYRLALENGLKEEVSVGQILRIPLERGNTYTVQRGDTKSLLCGSAEAFDKRNAGGGVGVLYPGMRIIL